MHSEGIGTPDQSWLIGFLSLQRPRVRRGRVKMKIQYANTKGNGTWKRENFKPRKRSGGIKKGRGKG